MTAGWLSCVLRPPDPERLHMHGPLNLHDLVHDELQQRREPG